MNTMRKCLYSLAIALFGSLSLSSCDESDDLAVVNEDRTMGNPTVTLAGIQADGTSTVIATIGSIRPHLALEVGVMIFDNEDFVDPVAFAKASLEAGGLWVAKVEKLKAGTKYYARAYAYGVDGYIVYSRNGISVRTAEAESFAEFGKGSFQYNASAEGDVDNNLTIYRSNINPNKFKIAPWYKGSELIFTVNEDNTIDVEEQETGYLYGSYGMVYVTTSDKLDSGADRSYYDAEAKIYNFNLTYYVYSSGKIGIWKKGVDTFTVE